MKLSSRNKRAFILIIVAFILFALLKFFLLPLYDKISDQKTNIKFKENTLEKYISAIEQQDKLKGRLKKLLLR